MNEYQFATAMHSAEESHGLYIKWYVEDDVAYVYNRAYDDYTISVPLNGSDYGVDFFNAAGDLEYEQQVLSNLQSNEFLPFSDIEWETDGEDCLHVYVPEYYSDEEAKNMCIDVTSRLIGGILS